MTFTGLPVGIYLTKTNQFQARVNVQGTVYSLGTFATLSDAMPAQWEKVKSLFPDGDIPVFSGVRTANLLRDLTGHVYDQLTVHSRTGAFENRHGNYWLCPCACGSTAEYLAQDLIDGEAKKLCRPWYPWFITEFSFGISRKEKAKQYNLRSTRNF
ncbi:hypothetical protein [Lacticaseibacillus manihotivorans]|uniref:hypothetical protein n=1 Tax=Lacticaseibacillus manihotivorans TaxID=88233 RepID=UPI0006D17DA0|nr:hypothetical protein [Lacticaseibacillus manihotivorans]